MGGKGGERIRDAGKGLGQPQPVRCRCGSGKKGERAYR